MLGHRAGGSRGIGLMIARGLVANGAHVFIVARKAKQCDAAAAALNLEGPGACIPSTTSLHSLARHFGSIMDAPSTVPKPYASRFDEYSLRLCVVPAWVLPVPVSDRLRPV